MMKFLGVVGLALLAFAVGVATYLATLGLVWGERISRGDLEAMLFWGGLAYGLVVLPVFLTSFLLLHLARRVLPGARQPVAPWFMPLFGALLGWAPTYALVRTWGGGLGTLAEPEALLFYSFFGGSGLGFGLGWWLLSGPRKHPEGAV
jgi:hypothetical protein